MTERLIQADRSQILPSTERREALQEWYGNKALGHPCMNEVSGVIEVGVVVSRLAPDTLEGRSTLAKQMATVHAFANPTIDQELPVEQLDMDLLAREMGVEPSQAETVADFMVAAGYVRSELEDLKRQRKRDNEEAARNGG